jgi:hypothetical protein
MNLQTFKSHLHALRQYLLQRISANNWIVEFIQGVAILFLLLFITTSTQFVAAQFI